MFGVSGPAEMRLWPSDGVCVLTDGVCVFFSRTPACFRRVPECEPPKMSGQQVPSRCTAVKTCVRLGCRKSVGRDPCGNENCVEPAAVPGEK
jgi:hypothetical protein